MRIVHVVDKEGFFIEDLPVTDNFVFNQNIFSENGTTIVDTLPIGLYKPRWDFENEQWVEGLKDSEIQQLQSNSNPSTIQDKVEYLEQADLDNKELITSLYEMLLKQSTN